MLVVNVRGLSRPAVFALIGVLLGYLLAAFHAPPSAFARKLTYVATGYDIKRSGMSDHLRPLFADEPKRQAALVGDSLINYAPWEALLPCTVNNFGIPGETTDGVLSRLDEVKPESIAFYSVGINDLGRGDKPETVAANLVQIAERSPAKTAYIQALFESDTPIGRKAAAVNAMLRAACTGKCRYFEAVTGNRVNAADTIDGVHVHYRVYRVWARSLVDAGVCGRVG